MIYSSPLLQKDRDSQLPSSIFYHVSLAQGVEWNEETRSRVSSIIKRGLISDRPSLEQAERDHKELLACLG